MSSGRSYRVFTTALTFLVMLGSGMSFGQLQPPIVVDQTGRGQFTTIQGAINSLPDSSRSPRIIHIRKGIYLEKIYVEKANLILQGEGLDSTIIKASIAREIWRCGHNDDWGAATVNIGANDITLRNLTVTNGYGFENEEREVYCASDTQTGRIRLVRKASHQMALRTHNNATRFRAFSCRFRSYGGDTVSPWYVEGGLWYFQGCIMEGGVDLYCPRGWAWAEDCTFIVHSGTAAIWHDGSVFSDSKSILKNCRFTGPEGFCLGRYHRDAQMYLINCVFGKEMKDTAIYRVQTSNKILWGERIFYSGCRRDEGKPFAWYSDNLPSSLKPSEITIDWVFGGKWNPLN
jgi:pectinesterase